MKLMVDTNVVYDFLDHRDPYYDSAEMLMTLGRINEFDLSISPSQVSDLLYMISNGGKKSHARRAKQSMLLVEESASICTLGAQECHEAFCSDWDDVEDALVYQAARSIQADAIITRNKRDFSRSRIPVFDCDEFFEWLREERGISYDYVQF